MLDHLMIPGIAAYTHEGLPAPAQTDDRNAWVDGVCWLYCGQRRRRVLWIGPANVAGMQAPMFACSPCITELHERVWRSVRLSDQLADPGCHPERSDGADYSRPRGGRHRASRSRFLRP